MVRMSGNSCKLKQIRTIVPVLPAASLYRTHSGATGSAFVCVCGGGCICTYSVHMYECDYEPHVTAIKWRPFEPLGEGCLERRLHLIQSTV